MNNKEQITIVVPKNLINPKAKSSNIMDDCLCGLPEIEKEYSAYDLLGLRKEITIKISELIIKLSNVKITIDEFNSILIELRANQYNLCLIKDVLSLANTSINSTIFTKDFLESQRNTMVNLQKHIDKVKQVDLNKILRDNIISTSSKIEICKKELTNYNNDIRIKIKLLNI